MIRMVREGDRLRCTGALEALLPDTHEGWGQLSRRARELHLLPPEVDKTTREYRFLPARKPQDAEKAWNFNIATQREQLADALRRAERARVGLVRLGESVEGVALPESPTAAPSTSPPSPTPAPPAAEAAPPVASAPPPAPEPAPAPQPVAPPPDPLRDAVRGLRDVAVRRKELYRVAVCTRFLDGADAVAGLTLSATIRTKVNRLSDAQLRTQCEQWVTESTPRASA